MSCLTDVKDALCACSDRVYHYFAAKAEPPYLVWSESGRPGFSAGDRREEYSDSGLLHLFTRTERDPLIDKLEAALDERAIGYELEAVQYEDDTGLLHYTWSWEAG